MPIVEQIVPLRQTPRKRNQKAALRCTYDGCVALAVIGRRCKRHRQLLDKLDRATRGTASERGYNAAWARESRRYLRENPLCVCKDCIESGRVRAATVVDHIVPHKGDAALFWDRSNWQSMAKRCHDRKTATQDGGFGRVGLRM